MLDEVLEPVRGIVRHQCCGLGGVHQSPPKAVAGAGIRSGPVGGVDHQALERRGQRHIGVRVKLLVILSQQVDRPGSAWTGEAGAAEGSVRSIVAVVAGDDAYSSGDDIGLDAPVIGRPAPAERCPDDVAGSGIPVGDGKNGADGEDVFRALVVRDRVVTTGVSVQGMDGIGGIFRALEIELEVVGRLHWRHVAYVVASRPNPKISQHASVIMVHPGGTCLGSRW